MANLNGEAWTMNRNFSLRMLRDLGFGRAPMEEHIREELFNLVHQIEAAKGRAIPVLDFIFPSILNISSALLFGTRYALGDPKREHLTKHVAAYVELFHSGTLIESKPRWLSKLEASLPFTRTGAMRRLRNVLLDFIRDRIKEHEDTIEADFNRDYIDGYSKEVAKRQHDSNSAFREQYLLGNIAELLLGSASNSPSLIHWLLLVCAQNPDKIQAKIQKEVDDVVGRQRQPTWEDRKAMPFTMASVIEITRWKVILAIGLPRGVQKDTSIGGHHIPKGTMVLVNVMGVHRNPELWENPNEFDPTRFLVAEGTELSKKPEHHIAFSLGRRKCPGEMLGNVELFLYLATLLQNFSVFPEEGTQLPDLGSLATTCCHPSVKKLRFVPRR
ncbi:cytochrome P450 2J2-like [Ixodes scapularis]|uniref:cytochrome P450 2J2-like n=1 Tax=Ixodes scapularis TaxID=6945 RepID=UPI001C38EB51|nr:cytochrome P450 2J2-like [Ixodes scapularis]